MEHAVTAPADEVVMSVSHHNLITHLLAREVRGVDESEHLQKAQGTINGRLAHARIALLGQLNDLFRAQVLSGFLDDT